MDSFFKLYELDYWKGMLLNVAHGMIPSCRELLVLLQRPDHMRTVPTTQNNSAAHAIFKMALTFRIQAQIS
jgi:hypothetical protein